MTAADLWDEREAWPLERRRELQHQRLATQLRRVVEASPAYGRRFAAAGFDPRSTTDLHAFGRLDVTTKDDYVASVAEHPPWGDYLAVEPVDIRRVHFSSGTTAEPVPCAWTALDLDRWADLYARFGWAQGVRPGDIYQCLFGFSWFVGGLGAIAGYGRLGATCIPGGSVDATRQVATMVRFGTTAVGGTPSFLSHLAEVARADGIEPRGLALRTIMVGGEPGGSIAPTRERLAQTWGATVLDGYGSLEFQPIAWECEVATGLHLADDFLYAEVVDAATGRSVPEGAEGVLVLTHLDKQAHPLVRWWTGDIVALDATSCPCGRTSPRLVGGVRGRADDMIILKGVNVFPSAVEDVVGAQPWTTGEYVLVVGRFDERAAGVADVTVRAEAGSGAPADAAPRLERAIRDRLGVRIPVELVDAGTLPRQTHKSVRIQRKGT